MSDSTSVPRDARDRRERRRVRRKSPLETLPKVNQLKRNGALVGKTKTHLGHPRSGGAKPIAPAGVRYHLEPEELRSFFRNIPTKSFWYSYFYIQYFYGCRLSEPALILDEDVNFKKKLVLIRRLKKEQEAEGYREYVYATPPRILECVRTALAYKAVKKIEENPFLFASNRKRTTNEVGAERLSQLRNLDGWQAVSRFTAHRMFQKVARIIRLPDVLLHSHVLRHTRAVMLLAMGLTPEKVREELGHSSLNMTLRYVDVADGVRKRLALANKHSVALREDLADMGLGLL